MRPMELGQSASRALHAVSTLFDCVSGSYDMKSITTGPQYCRRVA